jgi:hypothetical protein
LNRYQYEDTTVSDQGAFVRVYHFLNETYAVADISLRRLKVSRFNGLNDPFELLAADLLDPRHRTAFQRFKNELNETKGMISFSKSWGNPLLWGHYADCHRGMALGFDIPDDFLSPVIYTKQRAKIEFDEQERKVLDGDRVIDKVTRTKFSDWQYEEEYRMFIGLDEAKSEAGLHFVDFSDKLALCEVIVGLNCTLPIARVKQLLNGDLSEVRVKKAGLALRHFKVIEDRSARSQSVVRHDHS